MQVEKQFETPGFYFQWHFLESCNLRCKHCYQEGYVPQKADLTLVTQTIEQIGKALTSWDMTGRVSITGGEPLIDPTTLFFIIENLSKIEKITHLGILTNGTLLSDSIVEKLVEYPKLQEVQISLDGATAATHDSVRGIGVFDKAVGGLKKLIAAGIPTAIMFTASTMNSRDAGAIIDLAVEIGVNAITVERYTPFHGKDDPLALTPGQTKEIFETVLARKLDLQTKQHRLKIRTSRPLWSLLSDSCGGVCPVGFSCLTIMHDGTVYPCRRLPIPLGTVQKDGLFKIWYTSPVLWGLRDRKAIEKCSSCEKNHLCGGCRAAAYADSKNFWGPDPLCWKE